VINRPDELDYFRARLDRAADRFSEFGRGWADYLDRRPHRLVADVNYTTGRGVLRIERVIPIPLALSLTLGEFLYQLRAALDNCLQAVAVIDSGESPPPQTDQLEWPICLDEDAWEGTRKRRLSSLHPELQDALRAIQPFQAKCPGWNSLRLLHDMARLDRHRALHLVTVFNAAGRIGYDQKVIRALVAGPDAGLDPNVVATFTYTGSGPIQHEELHVDLEFDVDVEGVQESLGPNGHVGRPWGPLDKRLRSMHRAVLEYSEGLVAMAQELHPEEV
jgi:hypothetical protein